MTPERWKRIEALYQAAVDLEGEARAELLQRECADDASLLSEVEALLRHDARGDQTISGVIQRVALEVVERESGALVGRRLGAWRLVKRIAQGGMGAVYLGERCDGQFEQRAAVKLLNPALLSPEALARFNSERQILARLSHPSIARLYDGGTTDEGVPYLVMEYIEGLPIDTFCTERRLGTQARLELFNKVCAAVDYAHRNLVVHRDIKPSNILVDAQGEPKLLDFGVAKLIDREHLANAAAVTLADLRMLTPKYASPEQLKGETITTATDVYSLGVLLYELLSGRFPYADETGSAQALQQAILSTDPQRPSTAASRPDSRRRAPELTPERLRRELAGDLDNIVLMALRKEPDRRYGSAAQLAQDIDHHLHDLPVNARAATFGYRARKFVVRNRAIVAATGIALLTVASTVAAYTWRLERERDRAELAAAKSQQVTQFLVRLFEESNPWKAPGSTLTAADLLQQGLRDIDRLDDQPTLQAELLRVMGSSYTYIGETDIAIRLFQRALALYRGDPATDPLTLTAALMELSEALRLNGDLEPAEQALRDVLIIRRRVLGEQHAGVASALDRLGNVLHDRDRGAAAVEVLRRALAMKEALGEAQDADAADILNNLAISLDNDGRFEEAAATHRRAIALNRELIGPQHPDLATGIYNLGLVLTRLGRYEEAERNHREALVMRRAILGDGHWMVALSESSLAMIQARLGHFDEAVALAEHALAVCRETFGERHLQFSSRARHLSVVRFDLGDYRGAERAAREAVAAFSDRRSEYAAMLAWAEAHLALALLHQNRVKEARAALQPAFDLHDGVNIRVELLLQLVMAQVLTAERAFPEAERLFLETLAVLERVDGATNEQLSEPYLGMAKHYLQAGRPQQAVVHARRAFELSRAALGEHNWRTGEAAGVLAEALAAVGNSAEAKPLFELSRVALLNTFGDADPRVRRLAAVQGSGD